MALNVWKLPASPLWHILGGMTYPLYLLHNQIGKVIGVAIPSAPAFGLRLVVSLLCVGLLTWGVTLLVERRWAVTINRHLQRLISDWSLDFTQRRQATPPDCHSLKLRIKTR